MAGHWLQHDCHALQRDVEGSNLSLPWFILGFTWGKFADSAFWVLWVWVLILQTFTGVADWTPGRILKEIQLSTCRLVI